MKKFWWILALALLLFIGGVVSARIWFPRVIDPPPEVIYVDRQITKRDTITVVRPEVRIIYETVHDLRVDTIRVPVGFSGVGVISASPVRFDRGDVILTYFAFNDSAFVQDRFKLPRPAFSYYLSTVTGYAPLDRQLEVGLEAAARWRRLTLYGRITTTQKYQSLTLGLRYRIYGIE